MKYCTNCGKTLLDSPKFCGECGHKIKSDSSDKSKNIEQPVKDDIPTKEEETTNMDWADDWFDYDLFLSDFIDNKYLFLGHEEIILHLKETTKGPVFFFEDIIIPLFEGIEYNDLCFKFLYHYKNESLNQYIIVIHINKGDDFVDEQWCLASDGETIQAVDLYDMDVKTLKENSSFISLKLSETNNPIEILKNTDLFEGTEYLLEDVLNAYQDMIKELLDSI